MDLVEMRGDVENDLKDTSNVRWTDAELDRAIERAVQEYQVANPIMGYVDIPLVEGQYVYDLSSEAGYMWCEAVEYPIEDEDGPVYLAFREDRAQKRVWINPRAQTSRGEEPELTAGEDCRFWYAKAHTLTVDSSTIPMEHEDLIAAGAAAFAGLAMSAYAIDRIGSNALTPQQWRDWAEKRLADFRERLEALRLARVSGVGGHVVNWGGSV